MKGLEFAGPLDLEDLARRCFRAEFKTDPARPIALIIGAVALAMFIAIPGLAAMLALLAVLVVLGFIAYDSELGCLSMIVGLLAAWFLFANPGVPRVLALLAVAGVIAFSGLSIAVDKAGIWSRLKAYRNGDSDAVQAVHRFAVEEFRREIGAHRARTLGSDSEWEQARASLAQALNEADGSVAYWRLRSKGSRETELARRQLEVAVELERKLRRALKKLDGRADVLLRFYNDCDARLAVMDRCNRDMAEARRLEDLSGRADMVIAEAEGTLAAIGGQFVREAQLIGQAMGGLARVQLQSLAGEVHIDNIESLADRIIESSEAEERAIRTLDEWR